jgi:TolB-like protein
LKRPGELVTREELRRVVWGDQVFVSFDQGLNFCIKQIRAALGDAADAPRFVETLPRRGYRFLPAVTSLTREDEIARAALRDATPRRLRRQPWRPYTLAAAALLCLFTVPSARIPASAPPARATLAVLPFANLDAGSEPDRFSDGLTEETIHELGELEPRRLGVIARTSTMTYKGAGKPAGLVGRELGATYVLGGSVRRSGRHVLVSAELIRVQDLDRVWSSSYEAPLGDELRLQSEVAERITASVGAQIVPDGVELMPAALRGGPGQVDPSGA